MLVLGVIMLLIPSTSIANAQEYDRYYEDAQYKKDNKSNEPVIIIKNEPIQKKEKKKMKEPPMLVVKKDVLYCDSFSGSDQTCLNNGGFLGPDSDRYVQQCNDNDFVCDNINEANFEMIVTDNIEFPGSEKGKKINFNGKKYTVNEESNIEQTKPGPSIDLNCQESGFDGGFLVLGFAFICTLNEDCSGIIQDDELKNVPLQTIL